MGEIESINFSANDSSLTDLCFLLLILLRLPGAKKEFHRIISNGASNREQSEKYRNRTQTGCPRYRQ